MIIERIDRSGHVIDVFSFSDNRVSVGRGYSNDLILNDVYVDDKHLSIEYDYLQKRFVVTDLDSLNGLSSAEKNGLSKIEGVAEGDKSAAVDSGDVIVIGKTRLRLLDKEHVVEPARLLSNLDGVLSKIGTWWFALVITLVVLGTEALSAYHSDPFAEKLYKDMVEGLYMLFAAVAYAGVWVLVARTQRQDGRFLLHFNILLLASVLVSLYFLIHPVLIFNFEWLMAGGYITRILLAIGLFFAVYASCYQSTSLNVGKRVFVSLLLPALVFLGTIISELNRPDFRGRPPYNMVMVSPSWQWLGSDTVNEFLEESADDLYEPAKEDE